jgi:hypothetical protein
MAASAFRSVLALNRDSTLDQLAFRSLLAGLAQMRRKLIAALASANGLLFNLGGTAINRIAFLAKLLLASCEQA